MDKFMDVLTEYGIIIAYTAAFYIVYIISLVIGIQALYTIVWVLDVLTGGGITG